MNKRNLMIKAHNIAKSIVSAVGDYQVAMKIALKQAWGEIEMTKAIVDFGIAANNNRFVEAEAETVNIGDTFTKKYE